MGCYIGLGTYAARGVPERFRNPNALRSTEVITNPGPSMTGGVSGNGSTARNVIMRANT